MCTHTFVHLHAHTHPLLSSTHRMLALVRAWRRESCSGRAERTVLLEQQKQLLLDHKREQVWIVVICWIIRCSNLLDHKREQVWIVVICWIIRDSDLLDHKM